MERGAVRRIVWFSCGAASACAAKLALQKGPAEVVYCNSMASEHEDNARFLADVERWIGVKIQIIGGKFKTVDEVVNSSRYMAGPAGARCTVELKKKPRFAFQRPDDVHIFGFTAEERLRIKRFEHNNHELRLEWVLRDYGLTKPDCLRMIEHAGIKLPMMYQLGYANNNCPGCLKVTSPAYWNKIRRDFPAVFETRMQQSRELNVKLVQLKGKRIYLGELPAEADEVVKENLSCGPDCR